MKIVNYLIVLFIALLGVAAGIAKVMQTPQEMEFLQGMGLSSVLIIVFGVVQIAGGVLLIPQKTRIVGAVLAASAFAVSSILIFIGGNLAFGLFSAIPAALAGLIVYQSARPTHNKP